MSHVALSKTTSPMYFCMSLCELWQINSEHLFELILTELIPPGDTTASTPATPGRSLSPMLRVSDSCRGANSSMQPCRPAAAFASV
eukprot:CAMPEP_0177559334 /NCGR_PEP_ID=MMETSP0369-20130122/70775_1 /TAXON_ID=447022 ORGANISM="Scrippsiella hangoei-like, Strain SHHI-4" /NCGR_SAMPLE_ID=MMETSP0369 /ASSEMBLY_ACC=CAM_ASM_000364 /LENGTH=85 /DNA_ID=CAMNT_0019046045 /DNA_START=127 /DNA_END=381 /DNA_ORIENTATION=-